MDTKKKIAVYVDGFNLYHGLKNLKKASLKWLNLRSLVEKFINQEHESIIKIYYFSAIALHLETSIIKRHKAYIQALGVFDIEFVEGNFKRKQLIYVKKPLSLTWDKHEEKETDVNISIYMVRDAIKKNYDKFILITNDTDMVPAIKMAKKENPLLKIKLLTPPTFNTHDSLFQTVDKDVVKITENHLKYSLLPEKIKKSNGKIIRIPNEYKKLSEIQNI